nr:hypothetical protein [Methyloterricola oryzae]
MKTLIVLLLPIRMVLAILLVCASALASAAFTSDPIVFVAHGTIMGADGKPIEPDAEFFQQAQEFYIADLTRKLNTKARMNDASKKRSIIGETVKERVFAQALFIDWQTDRPYGNLGVTTSFRKDSQSAASTLPPGLTVPK